MENASKAIIIGGSILITVVIISLVALLFSQLASIKREEDSSLSAEQLEKFNRQFEVYNRNLYGSELLSLANFIKDFEDRQEVREDLITVTVRFDESCTDEQLQGIGDFFKREQDYDLETQILVKYQRMLKSESKIKDSRLVSFKRMGFRIQKSKTEYTQSGRISHLEFVGEGLSDTEFNELKEILDKL